VPTIYRRGRLLMVGTLRSAHPTNLCSVPDDRLRDIRDHSTNTAPDIAALIRATSCARNDVEGRLCDAATCLTPANTL